MEWTEAGGGAGDLSAGTCVYLRWAGRGRGFWRGYVMRWFSFGILVFVTLVLQVGLGRMLGVGPQHVAPDLLVLAAVLLAFRGPSAAAPMACWVLGLAKDLSSVAPLGCYAFSFGLLALVVVRLREMFYGEHPLTLITLTFLGSLAVEQFVLALEILRGTFAQSDYWNLSMGVVFSALLTGVLAPYGQWVVMRLHRQLGLPRRRSYGR